MALDIPFIYESQLWIICISNVTTNDLDCFLAMSAIYLLGLDLVDSEHSPISCLLRYHELLWI